MFEMNNDKRYSKEALDKMNVQERYEEILNCSSDQNIFGLIDIFKYNFKKYGTSASGDNLIALSYLFGRIHNIDEFIALLNDNIVLSIGIDEDTLNISKNLIVIGVAYPNLNDIQIKYLETLYNNPKYCALIDNLLFDKDLLPRKIKGITCDELQRKNNNFPDKLLDMVYNAFELNDKVENNNENTILNVYDRRHNTIIQKAYCKIGDAEFIASGNIDAYIILNILEEKYGEKCLAYFVKKVMELHHDRYKVKPAELRMWKNEWINYKMLESIAAKYYDIPELEHNIKHLIALAFLLKLN